MMIVELTTIARFGSLRGRVIRFQQFSLMSMGFLLGLHPNSQCVPSTTVGAKDDWGVYSLEVVSQFAEF